MEIKGFVKEGNFYKGNLHSHTINSDGKLTPLESTELYKSEGYDFISFTDHDVYTDYSNELNDEDFIIIPGVEASALLLKEGLDRPLKVHHFLGLLKSTTSLKHMEKLNVPVYYDSWDGLSVAQELNDFLVSKGLLTVYNHPSWSRVTQQEYIGLNNINGIEIYNFGTEIESGTGFDISGYDAACRSGKYLNCFATDDNHNHLLEDSCGGWICVKANALTCESIMEAIEAGSFYSSSGPVIYDWGIKDGVVYIETSDAHMVHFISGDLVNYGKTELAGYNITDVNNHWQFKLDPLAKYVRCEVVDIYGRKAWTNIIAL